MNSEVYNINMNIEPHKSLHKALTETRVSVATMGPYSKQIDLENIALSLDVLRGFILFCRKPQKKTWEDTKICFSILDVSDDHLKKVGNPPFLIHMQKVKNIIVNSYHLRCDPPPAVQYEAQCLVNTLENYIRKITNQRSELPTKVKPGTSSDKKNTNAMPDRTIHDSTILSLLERSKNLVVNVKMLVPELPMQNLISKFACAIEVYLIYCESGVKYYYNTSAIALEDLPCVNIKQCVPMTSLHELVQTIANLIIFSYPKLHIPPKAVVDEMRGFLRVLDKMEKRWKGTTESSQSTLDNLCLTIITKINNLIVKSFEGLVPSEKMQYVVTRLIDALDSYIPCFSSGIKYKFWDYTKKMFTKVKECNITENRAEMNLLELVEGITVVAHYNYIPPEPVQNRFSALKVTLEEWKAQWNTKKTANTGKTPSKPNEPTTSMGICMNSDDENLIHLLKKVRSDVDNYSRTPSKELQQELDDTVRHLQKCSAVWEKRSRKKSIAVAQSTSKVFEPELALPSFVNIPLTTTNTLSKQMTIDISGVWSRGIMNDSRVLSLMKGGFTPTIAPETKQPIINLPPSKEKGGFPPYKGPETKQPIINLPPSKERGVFSPYKGPETKQPIINLPPSKEKGGFPLYKGPETKQPIINLPPSKEKGGFPPYKGSETKQPIINLPPSKETPGFSPYKGPETKQLIINLPPSKERGGFSPYKGPETKQPIINLPPSKESGGFPPYIPPGTKQTIQDNQPISKKKKTLFYCKKKKAKKEKEDVSTKHHIVHRPNLTCAEASGTELLAGKKVPTNHMMITRSKRKAQETKGTEVETNKTNGKSKNLSSNAYISEKKYSKKLVTTVSCLNSTINRFVFDEISLTNVQIKNLKSAVAKLSSEDRTDVLETLTNIFAQIKDDILARSTMIDISILMKRFETKLLGHNTVVEDIVHDSFNENYCDLKNGNENYLERCASYNDAIENLASVNSNSKGLFEFTENTRDLIDASFEEVNNVQSALNETVKSNGQSVLNETVASREQSGLNEIVESSGQSVLNETVELNEQSGLNETVASSEQSRLNETVESSEQSGLNEIVESSGQSVINETVESNGQAALNESIQSRRRSTLNETSNDDSCSDSSDCEENANCFRIFKDNEVLVVEFNDDMIDYNATFSVIINQLDYPVIELTNRKLLKYDAFMLLPDDDDDDTSDYENKLKLEFPDVSTFVKFVHENEDLVRRLKLVSNESWEENESIPRKIQEAKKQLNEQCKGFIQSTKSITQQVEHQLKVLAACMASKVVENRVLRDLGDEIKSVLDPCCKLYVFGSRATGQALPDSDFDIYCDVTGRDYFRGVLYENQKRYVSKLGARLTKSSTVFSQVLPLIRTRVPIVKLFHKPTGMNCDVSFKDGTSVENTALLEVYLELNDRVRWVLTAVKLWANYNQITGSRYFTSHGLSWLVLFYLMQAKLVPPVMDLQENWEPKIINDWNVEFQTPEDWEPGTQASSLELFRGFFSWVVTTDLTAYCLCTVTGEAIPKKSFGNINWMKRYSHGVFRRYAERLDIGKAKRKFQISSYDKIEMNGSSGLCVQDPFEFCKNVVKPVKDFQYEMFQRFCRETNSVLSSIN